MAKLARRRNAPFFIAGGIAVVVVVAFFRLPDTLIVQIEHRAPATGSGGDWIYRLLAVVAVLQGIYVGRMLRPDKVKRSLPDGVVAPEELERLFAAASRSASVAISPTLVYGLTAFFLTGGRSAMWFFVVVMVAQGAWYYRQLGRLATWLGRIPGPPPAPPRWLTWRSDPTGYVPPVTRGLTSHPDGSGDGSA
jgi:hypothetical protein